MGASAESIPAVRPQRRRRVTALAAALLAVGLGAGHAAAAKPKPATAVKTTGIVDIVSTLGYQNGSAAGTGMIVTPGGEVLTNNHVVRGATRIRVVDVTTHRRYAATVVGYSVEDDVAVLQLTAASHLKTIAFGSSATLKVGQRVTAAGNAGGTGGRPKLAAGSITALHRSIVASDDEGGSEQLANLIQTDAAVRPGDSGGPLLNSAGRAVGIITAGSAGFRFAAGGGLGWAIPINTARLLASQIVGGQASTTVHIGPTAFLGVSISDAPNGGALVESVVPGSPAATAGLVVGDVITSLSGTAIAKSDDLRGAVLSLVPGTAVEIDWTDAAGVPATAQITPSSGPPQ
jgi:S1-C subfamily serine protease